MIKRGVNSKEIYKYILELFVEHRYVGAGWICDVTCPKFKVTRRAVNSRLQRLRYDGAIDFYGYSRAGHMYMTLHGEYVLMKLREELGDDRSLVQKALSGYTRWGQRRKNAAKSKLPRGEEHRTAQAAARQRGADGQAPRRDPVAHVDLATIPPPGGGAHGKEHCRVKKRDKRKRMRKREEEMRAKGQKSDIKMSETATALYRGPATKENRHLA